MTSDEATENVIDKQIPEVIELIKTGKLGVENIDVFCEKGVFNVEQTKSILKAGKDQGNFRINFHGEELNYLGSVEVSVKSYGFKISKKVAYVIPLCQQKDLSTFMRLIFICYMQLRFFWPRKNSYHFTFQELSLYVANKNVMVACRGYDLRKV